MPRQIKQDIVIRGIDKTTRGFRSVEKNMTRMERFVRRVQTSLLGFVGLNIAINLVRDLTRISDVAVELDAKMALVTTSVEDQTKAQAELTKVSLQSGSALEANTVLFTRLARPVRALGFALEDTLEVTKLIAQGLRISGASQQESASVIRQLSQAFQSGVLRGEEFNALMENGGRIAIALADGLGVTTGELRKMSKAGELSTERVINAFKKQADAIDRENARLPLTIGRAIENIRTKYLNFAKDNKEFNRSIADGINAIAQNMNTVLNVAGIALIATMGKLTQAFIASMLQRVKQHALDRKNFIEEQARNKASEVATLKKIQLESTATAAKARVTLAELSQAKAILLSKSNAIAATIALTEAELANATATVTRTRLSKLMLVQQASLTKVEATLTAAISAESTALAANTVAKRANATASLALDVTMATSGTRFARFANAVGLATTSSGGFAVGMGKVYSKGKPLAGLFSRMLAFIPKLGAALLGLPGLILLVVGSIAGMYLDWSVAWAALLVGLKKIISSVKLAIKLITTPFSAAEHFKAYSEELKAIDADFNTWTDNYIANENAQTEGFADAAAKRAKIRQQELQDENRRLSKIRENEKEITDLRKKYAEQQVTDQEALSGHAEEALKARLAVVDSELALEKDRIAGLQLASSDHDKQVALAESAAAKRSTNLTLQSLNTESETWSTFYTDQQNSAAASTQELFNIATKAVDDQLAKDKEGIEALTKGRNDFSEQIAVLERRAAKEHFDLIADKIKKDGESFRKSHLDELIKDREFYVKKADALRSSLDKLRSLRKGYLDAVKSGEQELRAVEKRSSDFLRKLNEDNTTNAGKAASAQNDLAAVQSELRRIEQLDLVNDADEIKGIRATALSDLESIASAEKSRGEALKAGSIDAIQANNTQREAAELYKTVISDTVALTKQDIALNKERAITIRDTIAQRVDSLQKYEAEIKTLDDQIKVQREIVIEVDSVAALAEIAKIDESLKKLKNKTITITTVHKTVTGRQGGGFGELDVRLANGGYPRRKDKVPGSGNGDKVKALLEPEEFIVKKSSSKVLGAGFLNMANQSPQELLNLLDNPVRRKFGGFVSRNPAEDVDRLIRSYKAQLADAKGSLSRRSSRAAGGYDSSRRDSQAVNALTTMVKRAESLRGKDSKTVSAGKRLLTDYFQIQTFDVGGVGTAGYLRYFGKLLANNNSWSELLRGAADYVAPVADTGTTTAPTTSSTTTSDGISEAVSAVESASSTKTSSRGVGAMLNRGVVSAVRGILPSVTSAARASVAQPAPQPVSQVTSSASGVAPRSQETITVNLRTDDGQSATGIFDASDVTRALIDSLRKNGQVVT